MPGLQVGVYPGELAAGTQVSSTYEGRHLTVLESELIHPFNGTTFVAKGEQVLLCRTAVPATYGIAVGVAFNTATAATDLIAIDTEGIWNLTVFAQDDLGAAAIEIGDPIYIHDSSVGAASLNGLGDAELSKITTPATQRFFGYALGRMVAGGSGQIAVKAHFDQLNNWLLDDAPMFFGDDRDVDLTFDSVTGQLILTSATVDSDTATIKVKGTQIGGLNTHGIAGYFDANFGGQMVVEHLYGFAAQLNLAASFDNAEGFSQVCSIASGIFNWTGVVDGDSCDLIYGIKAEGLVVTAPHGLYFAALNSNMFTAAHTAIFYAHNTGVVGHLVAQKAGTPAGCLALAYVNGSGFSEVLYVNLWLD